MLNVCLTFDYELFFGDNYGTDREILFDPTRKLIQMLKEEGVSATFFADTCSITQNIKFGRLDYVNDFTNQIKDMVCNGQDVQLHIHSHWLNSVYENDRWNFSNKGYRIQEFDTPCSHSMDKIIIDGINYLTSTLRTVQPDYKCIAFRAGGFTIQPHENLVRVLYDNGIRIDSSVAPMLFSDGTNAYDFRKKVTSVNWKLGVDAQWCEDSTNAVSLWEVPIATENKNPIVFFIKRVICPAKIKLELGTRRGTYIKSESSARKSNKIVNIIRYITCYNAMSMDAYNYDFLYKQLVRFSRKHDCKNTDCTIALIGHPKLVNDTYIENLRILIRRIKADNQFRIMSVTGIQNSYLKKV